MRRRHGSAGWVLAVAALSMMAACSKREAEPRPDPAATASATAPMVFASGVRVEEGPASGDLATAVREARDRETKRGRKLLVYVGATWCEPCQRFHKAAAAGKLDDEFPDLTLLEFDADRDRDRLSAAGYTSDLIPLFVKPNADGRASDRRFEGSVKGDGALANIAPRLRRLVSE